MTWMRRGAQVERAARRDNRRQHAQRQDHDRREARTPAGASAHAPARAGRAMQRPAPSAAAAAASGLGRPVPDAPVGPAVPVEGPAEAEADAGAGTGADTERRRDRAALYDIQAAERAVTEVPAESAPKAGTAATMMPLVDEDDIPLTWDPVPVPRPTYTMKAMAQRHAPAPVGQGVPPAGRAGIRGAGPARRRRVGRRPRRPQAPPVAAAQGSVVLIVPSGASTCRTVSTARPSASPGLVSFVNWPSAGPWRWRPSRRG